MGFLGIDYGSRRVGIAVSSSGVLATPHSVIPNEDDPERLVEALAALADEEGAGTIVLGIPSRRDPEDPALLPFHRLAGALRQRTRKEVVLWDESFSTTEASSRRRERGARSRRRDPSIDQEAAAVILQSYLDSLRGETR